MGIWMRKTNQVSSSIWGHPSLLLNRLQRIQTIPFLLGDLVNPAPTLAIISIAVWNLQQHFYSIISAPVVTTELTVDHQRIFLELYPERNLTPWTAANQWCARFEAKYNPLKRHWSTKNRFSPCIVGGLVNHSVAKCGLKCKFRLLSDALTKGNSWLITLGQPLKGTAMYISQKATLCVHTE